MKASISLSALLPVIVGIILTALVYYGVRWHAQTNLVSLNHNLDSLQRKLLVLQDNLQRTDHAYKIEKSSYNSRKLILEREQQLVIQQSSLKGADLSFSTQNFFRTDDSSFLFVAILSGFSNFYQRQTVRETWIRFLPLKNSTRKVTWRFMLGDLNSTSDSALIANLTRENEEYKDLLFVQGANDLYLGLGHRVANFILNETRNFQFEYLFKTDDDSYIRIRQFVELIEQLPRRLLLWGKLAYGYHVFGHPNNRWHNDDIVTISNRYPTYALGDGYLLTRDVVEELWKSSVEQSVWLAEDAQTGGWVSPYLITLGVGNSAFWEQYSTCKDPIVLHRLKTRQIFNNCYTADLSDLNLCFVQGIGS